MKLTMKLLPFVLALLYAATLFFLIGPRAHAAELHYAPLENLEALDVGLIDQAREKIDFACYGFTSTPVIFALAEAARRGVHVRIYRDHTQAQPIGMVRAALDALSAAPGVEIKFKPRGPIMHLKSYAVDGVALRSGSANFTHAARRQDNDLVIEREAASVAAFERNFELMWGR